MSAKIGEITKIRKGIISYEGVEIPVDFGLVYHVDGIIDFDFYVTESFNFNKLIPNLLQAEAKFSGYDENGIIINISYLYVKGVYGNSSKITMTSAGEFVIKRKNLFETDEQNERERIYFIEVEGLKLKHTDHTDIRKTRNGEKVISPDMFSRDYTGINLICENASSLFHITFRDCCENENTIIVFDGKNQSYMYYDFYQEIKRDFIRFLSFINGKQVRVRREGTGCYYSPETFTAEREILYSYPIIKEHHYSSFIPLNDEVYLGERLLYHCLFDCFQKYTLLNKVLDFNSIALYLNGATQAKSYEEKFFILIIAFERIAQLYIDSIKEAETNIINPELFTPIEESLQKAVKGISEQITKEQLNVIKSKISNLNKKSSATDKFIKLLDYANIQTNSEIDSLIKQVRHKSVHCGEIGDGLRAVRNYYVLDHLLRDIILNLIGYNRTRSRYY